MAKKNEDINLQVRFRMIKEKINIEGVEETMFVPLIARALESKKKNPAFYDAVAVRVLETLNYDFSKHKAKMNMWGCAARTIILDREVKSFIAKNPDCSIINIACGLDDRFSRVDNGTVNWYNVDLENIINIRKNIFEHQNRRVDIARSILDYSWIEEIKNKENVLIVAEGILMYFTENEVKDLFQMIAKSFPKCSLVIEIMSEFMLKNQKKHETIKKTTAKFKWGIKEVADFVHLCPDYEYVRECNFTTEMKRFAPIRIGLISPMLKSINNKIGIFNKRN